LLYSPLFKVCSAELKSIAVVVLTRRRLHHKVRRPSRRLEETLADLRVLPHPVASMAILIPGVAAPFLVVGPTVGLLAVFLDSL
jgi:hypothetical protein